VELAEPAKASAGGAEVELIFDDFAMFFFFMQHILEKASCALK
jgi:hypothetical protein